MICQFLQIKFTKPPLFSKRGGLLYLFWCPERDLNPHTLRHTRLRRTCLPFHHLGISVCTDQEASVRVPLSLCSGVRLSNIRFTHFEPHVYHSITWAYYFTDWIIASFYTLQALHLHKVLILELSFSVFLICKYHPISSYHSRNSMLYCRAIRSSFSLHSELDSSTTLGSPIFKKIISDI